MKIKRLFTINTLLGAKEEVYTMPVTKKTPYIVDDSHFTPMAEAIKQLSGSRPLTDEEVKACYDFKDGKDNGMKIGVTRQNNFCDISELTENMARTAYESAKSIKDVKEQQAFKAKLDKITAPVESKPE